LEMRRDCLSDDGMEFEGRAVGVVFDPPVTVEACRLAGRRFGGVWAGTPRIAFEEDLVARLASLEDALRMGADDSEDPIAAFDQAAWMAWEAGAKRDCKDTQDTTVPVDRTDIK
jgi:hypothetical protein